MLVNAYQVHLRLRKIFLDNLSGQGQVGRIFSHRYLFGTVIFLFVFLVTGTNIYASAVTEPVGGVDEHHNLMMKMTVGLEDELLLEEADYDPGISSDAGYLDGQAVDIRDFYAGQGIDGGLVAEEDSASGYYYGYGNTAISALRNIPEADGTTAETETVRTRTRIVEYVVESGDNAESIARKFGLSTKTVLECNGLGSRSVLGIGRKMSIPPVDGVIHTVRSGDTVNSLAAKYGAEPESIAEINGISPNDLAVGMVLAVPGGKLPAPPPAPKPVTRYASVSASPVTASAPDLSPDTKLLWPTSARRITQYYTRLHNGLDIAGPMRTPLYAAESGTVIFSGWNSGGYGNMVLVDHGGGLFTRYAHATQLLVRKGDQVNRGDTIALMGSTGRSTGPHIHFEVAVGSVYNRVNPLNYIR
ncbi:M23 family metallopeptidase [Candidatus Uhrbacteria bacterium]|nr:M23 family metallopeptidase [Candidatus Uhrbacteria bacterium]